MNKKTTILILGGVGYIGGHTVNEFLNSDYYDLTVYDNLSFERNYLKKVKFIYGDIRDYKKLKSIINNYDVVINLAGIVGDPACQANKELAYDVNVRAVDWLAENYKGYLFSMSTCSVYGMNDKLLDENSETNPLSWYALNKLESENILKNKHNNFCMFRLGTVYGMADALCRMRFDLVVNVLSIKAANNETITVFGGDQWRPLIHVEDIATAIKAAVDNRVTGIYNLVDDNWKIADLARAIAKIGGGSDIVYNDVPFQDTRNYKVSGDKFLKLKIWKPQKKLELCVSEMISLIKENRFSNVYDSVYYNAQFMKENNGKFK